MGFHGHATEKIENDLISVEYLIHGGPRIVRLEYKPAKVNLFAEIPEIGIDTPAGKYMMLGGHRLWAAPESVGFTYVLDDKGLEVRHSHLGIDLVMPGLPPVFHYKQVHLSIDPHEAVVHVMHSIRNDTTQPVKMAAWAITQMVSGGVAILPTRKAGPPASMLLPDRSVTYWPYTTTDDPNIQLTDDQIIIDDRNISAPTKVGVRNPTGSLAYIKDGLAFVKHAPFDISADYPDFGCNSEVYSNGKFLELESLSGLTVLDPGRWVVLEEEWRIEEYQGKPEDFVFTK